MHLNTEMCVCTSSLVHPRWGPRWPLFTQPHNLRVNIIRVQNVFRKGKTKKEMRVCVSKGEAICHRFRPLGMKKKKKKKKTKQV